MRRHRLDADALKVESFGTGPGDVSECVCDYPPCICTAGEDCTQTQP